MTYGPSLGDRLAGAVWGHLIGDALGVPYEFRRAIAADEVHFGAKGSHDQPPGTWSDDGALMLALLDSLLESGFDTTDQAKRALAWFRDGDYTPDHDGRFDSGNATRQALERFARGVPAEEAGDDPDALGNGSLMRILPLALVQRDLPDKELVEHAHRASKVTHGALAAQVPCALYVLIARQLLAAAEPSVALGESRTKLRELYSSDGLDSGYLAALSDLESWTGRSGQGLVTDSFWSAWDAFTGADSYQDTIKRAVAYGNDTDTTAAIAGGLAGIYWTIDGIPGEWLAGMRGKEVVWPLVGRLLERAGYKSSEIRVAWVALRDVPSMRDVTGRLGMTFLPGKRYPGQSGEHWRHLATDAATLRDLHGVDTLLLLVEDHELEAAGVSEIAQAMEAVGIELLRYPMVDMGVPVDADAFRETLRGVLDRIRAGRKVVVACMGGLGRTGTTVACLLREAGLHADDAVIFTRMARMGAIETQEQIDFVCSWSPTRSVVD